MILPLVPAPHLLEQSLPQKGTFFVSPLDSESFFERCLGLAHYLLDWRVHFTLGILVDILENITNTQVKKH